MAEFEAEVKEVKSRTTTSNDKEYRIVITTWDPSVVELFTLPPLSTVKVKIKPGHRA